MKKNEKNIKVFEKSVDQYNRGGEKTMKRNGKFLGSFEIEKAKEIAKKLLAKGILTHMFGNTGQVILFLGAE